MGKFIRIGIDLGKNSFQIHALESEDGRALTRKRRRAEMRKFFEQVRPCLIGMEACGSAHYWARELEAMGHEVKLIPPIYVKPYVKRSKNGKADAAARRSHALECASLQLRALTIKLRWRCTRRALCSSSSRQ